jgi:hypothetical protein
LTGHCYAAEWVRIRREEKAPNRLFDLLSLSAMCCYYYWWYHRLLIVFLHEVALLWVTLWSLFNALWNWFIINLGR